MSAYTEGFDTYFENKDMSYNPYTEGVQAWLDWRDGWLDAEDYEEGLDYE